MCEDMCDDCRFYENSPSKFPCSSCTCGKYFEPKEQPFEPEYFSGLNWRDALPLVEHVVEFSCDGEVWRGPYVLQDVIGTKHTSHRYRSALCNDYLYIRTTPETNAHPTVTLTVNGREWVLPKPETNAPADGWGYWFIDFAENGYTTSVWTDDRFDNNRLKKKAVHLTESRAQAWADFWKNGIMAAVRGGDK
jgi:hypothetical protein